MQTTVLYSNNCPKCRILKQKLDEKNITYEVCSDIELMLSKGFMSMPMLEVDGEVMDFNNALKWTLSHE